MTLLRPETIIFFFNDTATTEIYTLSLHDALPIWSLRRLGVEYVDIFYHHHFDPQTPDRKSTRLNSSHVAISYAVFCLTKKKKPMRPDSRTKSTLTTPISRCERGYR